MKSFPTLVEVLRQRAGTEVERPAYTFLDDGETVSQTATYGELWQRATTLAAGLGERGLRGERILLSLPPGLELAAAFLGCLIGGAVAVPLPEGSRRRERFLRIREDCQATAVWSKGGGEAPPDLRLLSTEGLLETALGTDATPDLPVPPPEAVAFLQYTSGSTGHPKGAVITHGALAANLEMIRQAFELDPEDVVGSWLPPFHDMGLVGGLLAPLWAGIPAVLMPPLAFLARPLCWLEMIQRFRVTVSGGPDFAYRLCLERIPVERRRSLDLFSWQLAFSGAEPVRSKTLEAFAEAFSTSGFRRAAFLPCYGLAEATLLVSAGRRGREPRQLDAAKTGAPPVVSCGGAACGVRISILDPETGRPPPAGQEGEIWVASPSLAAGYWSPPPAGEGPFFERLAAPAGTVETAEGPWLRTGDLGLLSEGELHVTGRLKDLIILRGRNVHPEDLEALALACHPLLAGAQAAAFGVPAGEEEIEGERAVLVISPPRTRRRQALSEGGAIRLAVRRAVQVGLEVEVTEIHLVRPGALPLTSSGKVQRHRARELFLSGSLPGLVEEPVREGLPAVGPRPRPRVVLPQGPDPRDAGLRAGDLGLDPEGDRRPLGAPEASAWLKSYLAGATGEELATLGAERSLADFGLDSMGITRLQHGLEGAFGVRIPLVELLEGPSLGNLAERLASEAPAEFQGEAGDGPAAAPLEGPRRLSEGQEALFYLQQAAPESTAYHLASAFWVEAELEEEEVRRALEETVSRHDALSSGLLVSPSSLEPRLRRLPPAQAASLSVEDATSWTSEELLAGLEVEVRRPFDLAHGPLLRLHLWRRPGGDLLLLNLHHLAGDLWSVALVWRELSERLAPGTGDGEGEARAAPSFYAWTESRRHLLEGPRGEAALAFWRRRLDPLPPPAELPADRAEGHFSGSASGAFLERLAAGSWPSLESLARRRGTTPHAVLLAAFQACLARITGLQRFTLGTLSARREELTSARVVGYLVNPLVMVAEVVAEETFETLLGSVRRRSLEDLAHGDFPFRRLVRELSPPRSASGNPFFSYLLSWQGTAAPGSQGEEPLSGGLILGVEGARTDFAGAPARCRALPPRDPVFPLSLLAAADEEDLLWRFEYRADLYDRTTVLRFARCLRAVLEQVLEDPSIPVASLSLLQPGQRHQVLFELNDTAVPTSSGTLLEEILAQARCRPRAVALRQGCRELSYGELAGGSLQLAAVLRDLGVGRESVVALALERSPEWVLGALATLLAGGAFLPLDPGEPEPRLRGMLEDGAPDLVLHQGSAPAALGGRRLLDLDCLPQAEPLDGPWPEAPEQLAYVLFTSGSTGRPKGAMNSRGALANRIRWMQRAYRLEPRDRVLQKTPLTFDVALWEVFWPLTAGARLLLAPPGAHRDPRQLVELISAEEVTVLHFVPSLLPAFLSQARRQGPGASRSLRLVVASGEALEGELASSFRRQMGTELRFENLYGPTEAAIDVTAYSVPGEVSAGAVPLGGAVDNTAIHLLDGRLQPVGLGIPGELFIGGVQLARGYRRDPRRTAERFLPDPFSPCGGRLYRSGDLVRRLSDGRLIFLRRLDGQVKVRGVRIELGEVEAVLVSHPGILEAAALLVSDRSGPEAADSPREGLRRFSGLAAGSDRPPRLVAFYVAAAAEEVSPAELRTFLRHRLPPAMEPQALIPLRELPRTASGKLDRSRLPRAELAPGSLESPYVPPRTQQERLLAAALERVLGVSRVGAEDDFFALGGDSIQSLRVRTAVEEQGWELSLESFPELRTVAAMAEAMRPRSPVEEGSPFELISPSDRIRLPSGLEDAYPLARTQSGVIFHCQFDASTSMYRDLFMVRLEGPLVPALLERSLRAAVERHPMLRTTFDLESYTEPLQLVWRRAEVALVVEDLPVPGPGSLTENSFPEPWMRQEIARPLDWSRAPLPRFFALWVPGGAFWFAASFFDALFDGWSAASLASEVLADYDHLLAGEAPPERRPPAGGYRRFIAAERQALGSAQEREFWRECLEGVGSGALPGFEEPSARGAGGEEAVRIVEVEVEAPLAAALEDAARKAGAELKQLLLAAHLASLSAFCGLRELTTGLEVHCRPDIAGADGILGMHMNILPFPMEIGVGSRRGWLRAVAEQERRWLRHRRFPFAEMARGRREAPKVETVFNFTHFHVLASLGSLLRLEAREAFGFNRTSFSLRADFNRHPLTGRLGLSLSARTEALSRARHRRLASIYRSCLEAWALRPEGDCRDFPTLPESERHQVLLEWGHAGASAAPPRLLPQAFRLQAARTPERTALEAAGETLSYGELKRRVEELAFRLRQASTADSEVVGIFAARSVAYVTAALAVAMAGKALLPLSVREPSHRLEEKVLQAGVRTVLVSGEARLPGSLAALAVPISEGAEGGRIVPSELLPTPPAESPAYLMFTSGSTGRPKAVVVSHGALGGFFSAMVQALGVAEGERWLAMTETTFDISLLELFLPLLTGGTVVLSPPEATLEPQDLLDQVADRRLRTIQATPAVWQTLLDAGWTGWSGLRVLCGGETLAEELASRLRHGGSEVWNLYGPTEATVWATARRLREEETVSLGAPLPGVAAYVLDPHLRLLGEGVPGELFLSGRGLAQGYGGDPRANATAFLPDPFSRLPGARLYRTGDRCQWSPEGRLLFLGRLDSQVKIRGIRVEPAEVEAALLACDDVHRALVLVEETAPGHRGLLAYVEPRIGVATTEQALRRFLGGRLPSFLIPSRIFVVPSWPLTRHGKVDRRRLPKPRSPRPTEETLESLVDFLEEMTEEEARALAEPGAE